MTMILLVTIIPYLVPALVSAQPQYGGAGFSPWLEQPPPFQRPVDVMTDVVNDLGIKILRQYSEDGNVAFSPTGVGFVLAALYEGAAGKGHQQIADALRLPWNRDVTRVGLRDIHRRLRSYLSADGFLGGLTLNKVDTRLRPEYEDILQFYGFDLSSTEAESNATKDSTFVPEVTTAASDDGNGSTEPIVELLTTLKSTSEVEDGTTTDSTSTEDNERMPTQVTMTDGDKITATNSEHDEESTNATMNPEDTTTISDETTTEPQRLPSTTLNANAEGSTLTSEEGSEETTTNPPREIRRTSTNTEQPSTERSPVTETPMMVNGFEEGPTTMSNEFSETPGHSETSDPPEITTGLTMEPTTTETDPTTLAQDISSESEDDAEIETTTVQSNNDMTTGGEEDFQGMEVTTMRSMNEDLIRSTPTEIGSTTVTEDPVIRALLEATSALPDATMEPASNLIDSNTEGTTVPTSEATTTSSNADPTEDDIVSSTEETTTASEILESVDENSTDRSSRSTRSPRSYFQNFPDEGMWMQDVGMWTVHSPNIGEAIVRDSTELSFLVNGCDVTPVSAAAYTAVLPFAFLPSLQALALEFPLDDPRYNILLILPADRDGAQRLTRDLGAVTLRELRKELQPAWVRAMIPSFMLRGFVTLTPFLQRLGIKDVFEPRVADLSPMSTDIGVYARDVQQSIGVNIRNYMKPDRTHSRNGLFERAGPVSFTAEHPFLYFIIDAQTGVSLIAGRIDDPLNSRIL